MSDAPKLVNDFLFYLEHTRKYSKYTLRSYQADLFQFLIYLNGRELINLFPQSITQKDVRKYLAHLRGQGFLEATVSRKLASLRSFYRWMLRERLVDQNPTRGFASPRVLRTPVRILTESQVQTLIGMADRPHVWGRRDRAILELLYSPGVKIGELTALDWSDVNLDEQHVHIKGRGSQDRLLLLRYSAQYTLDLYMKALNLFQIRFKERQAVFLNRSGCRLTARSIGRIVDKYAKRAGLPKWVAPQTLRHSMAAHMLDRGTNLEDVQKILGHQSIETTRIYTKSGSPDG